jgi:hypothetical protein
MEKYMSRQGKPSVGRLDNIIKELERLHHDAQDIFDAHVDLVRCQMPEVSFGILKSREIAAPAGNSLNYVNALKIVRQKIVGEDEDQPGPQRGAFLLQGEKTMGFRNMGVRQEHPAKSRKSARHPDTVKAEMGDGHIYEQAVKNWNERDNPDRDTK